MKFSVITLFPKMIEAFLSEGLVSKAVREGKFSCESINPRVYTTDAHQSVDDRAFGGADGMVMKYEPLAQAIQAIRAASGGPVHVALLSPQGRPWKQSRAREWLSDKKHVVLVCGRYAGVDQRFALKECDEEISIGDYVLNGGELAACVVMESIVRLIPGVLGNELSAARDSFTDGLLECPSFTRPREVAGLHVPAALLSGNHKEIAAFERAVSFVRTKKLRPDLWHSAWDEPLREARRLLRSCTVEDLHVLGLDPKDLQE